MIIRDELWNRRGLVQVVGGERNIGHGTGLENKNGLWGRVVRHSFCEWE